MALYQLFGYTVESDFPLQLPGSTSSPDFLFTLDEGPVRADEPIEWSIEHQTPSGSPWLSIGDSADSHLLRFHDLADFLVWRDGRIGCQSVPGTADYSIRHLLVAHVLPRVLAQRGELIFHGSAVTIEGRAVAVVGKSGSGKSTLVAALASSGLPVLTDDGLLVRSDDDHFSVVPSYPEIRMWPDTADALFPGRSNDTDDAYYAGKVVIRDDSDGLVAGVHFDEEARPLSAILFVDDSAEDPNKSDFRLSPKSAGDAHIQLMEDMFRLERPAESELRGEFELLSGLAASVPCFDLRYPRSFEHLPAIVERIRAEFG